MHLQEFARACVLFSFRGAPAGSNQVLSLENLVAPKNTKEVKGPQMLSEVGSDGERGRNLQDKCAFAMRMPKSQL